ncbi:hypothetical protein UPYG_G00195620 [Umbra pygmaea]|uniref:SERTA domain-containing protein n=1 Tax=Umbra pygmaea TaxID=75934 RepID=A0ABD0WHZ6_UMBPY
MISKGQKRKLHDDDVVGDVRSAAWESQRQSLLDISLEKYHRSHDCMEHSLRRSVLIANTLKHMHPENRPLSGSVTWAGPMPSGVPPCTMRESGPGVLTNGDVVVDMEHEWLSSESDFSLSAAVSSILKELDMTMAGGPGPGTQSLPFKPAANLAADLGLKQYPSGNWSSERCAEGCRTSERVVFADTEEVVRSSYDGTLDDLLHDINTSVFEREMGAIGVRDISGAASDELLKYLPPLTSVPSSSQLPISLSQSAMNLNELEHIMEMLFQS